MTDASSLSASADAWALRALSPNLAALTCKHILHAGRRPGFVDYRGGHLTVLCEEKAHQGDTTPDVYGMVHLGFLLSSHHELSAVRLVGGYSNATRSEDGTWTTQVIPKPTIGERLANLMDGIRAVLSART